MKSLRETSDELSSGAVTSRALTEEALSRIEAPGGEGRRAFVRIFRDAALAAADSSDRLRAVGIVPSPLAGVPISVKDLCDVAGITTLAGSAVRAEEPPAERDAAVVARLRAAGAVIVGTTNMTEFAMGCLGLNPHHGDCRNPWDRATGRVPGGSSSGAAVSVTDGMAAGALGSDTAGSVRIPAALCGLAGFKPTAARVPVDGIFPLSTTLDSVGPLAPTAQCCALLDAVFAGEAPTSIESVSLSGIRLGLPTTLVLDGLDEAVGKAFERAISRLSAAGARIEEFPFPAFAEIAAINRARPISVMESYAIHRERLERHADRYDPRVSGRILGGAKVSATDYYDVLRFREDLLPRAARLTGAYDAVIMPTTPVIAPPIADFVGSDERLRDPHAILIRNTNNANFLDRCALTVPCHETGTPPVGFMLMGERMADRRLLAIGIAVEKTLAGRA